MACAVEGSDPGDDLGIVDQQESPVLGVAAGGGPDGGVEDPGLHVEGTGSGRTLRMARVV